MDSYTNYSTNCELLYRSKDGGRAMFKGTFWECRAYVDRWTGTITDWAIYKVYHKGRRFHNATDPDFLEDHDDRYWHNVRFGHVAPAVTLPHPWVFWAGLIDEDGMFVRQVEERSSFSDVADYSRAFHDIARRHGYRWFVPDQTLTGGYFVARDGSCLYARPKGMRPHPELPER